MGTSQLAILSFTKQSLDNTHARQLHMSVCVRVCVCVCMHCRNALCKIISDF